MLPLQHQYPAFLYNLITTVYKTLPFSHRSQVQRSTPRDIQAEVEECKKNRDYSSIYRSAFSHRKFHLIRANHIAGCGREAYTPRESRRPQELSPAVSPKLSCDLTALHTHTFPFQMHACGGGVPILVATDASTLQMQLNCKQHSLF